MWKKRLISIRRVSEDDEGSEGENDDGSESEANSELENEAQ